MFISDFHLGSVACKVQQLEEFLHAVDCEHLYLVGDIIDVWVSARAGKWNQHHTNVIRTILGKSKRGTLIYYTPGNHDAFLRKVIRSELGNIVIDHDFVHTGADGRRYLVVHGDFYDKSVTACKPLAWAGTWLYEGLAVMHQAREKAGAKQKPGGFSLKKKFKGFIEYFTNYEEKVTVDAAKGGYAGVICGHIHKPKLVAHESGALYINTGDWIENMTAVVEHFDGRLELIYWDVYRKQFIAPEPEPLQEPVVA